MDNGRPEQLQAAELNFYVEKVFREISLDASALFFVVNLVVASSVPVDSYFQNLASGALAGDR